MVIVYTVATITALYFLFAFLAGAIRKVIGKKICAICAAVSLTWVGLLVLWLVGLGIDPKLPGILMGGSVVGIMYQAERYFSKRKLAKFWLVRILIITLGFALVYFLLEQNWLVIGALAILSLVLTATVFLLPAKKEGRPVSPKLKKQALAKLEKMMENCC